LSIRPQIRALIRLEGQSCFDVQLRSVGDSAKVAKDISIWPVRIESQIGVYRNRLAAPPLTMVSTQS
jgi:hypothetical protein